MTPALAALFAPGTIGSMTVRNRIAMPPMGTNYATWTGAVTDRLVRYHVERARGGVGLITVEFTYVHPTGKMSYYALGIHDDRLVPGLRRLTDAVHAEGARISIQLAHGGRRARSVITGAQPLAPSALPCIGGEVPRELSTEEIATVISWFVRAAGRARDAGFDALTLHLANGYLLQSFMSPYANRRTDRYGGSVDNRARLPLEIVDAIRGELGGGFPIIARLSVDDFVEGGVTLDDGQRLARLLERAGVDAIDVTAGLPESMHVIGPPMAMPRGFLVPHARAIKAVVGIPVFAVGRLGDPVLADRILREGSADFVSMGRPLLVDPELPRKASEGRLGDVRPCIACNEGCFDRLYAQLDISCALNPRVGREALFPAERATAAKTVLVVGGGPAGMMAATTAAARGHRVVLCERGERLGGQLLMGDVPPHKEEIRTLREHLAGQLDESGVETRLGTAVTADTIEELGADVVIVATGATPVMPAVPVADARVVSAWDVLAGAEPAGSNVVVIGGGEVGCELAEHLAARGARVTIVELLGDVATSLEPRGRTLLLGRLRELGVNALTRSRVTNVRGTTVVYQQGGVTSTIDGVDTVVSAVGSASSNPLADLAARTKARVVFVGDCVKPRRILDAVREGFEAGYSA